MLPIAERSAMRLDGELVALGDTALHVDRLVGPVERLRALALPFGPAHIVSGRAAAWVLGVAPLPRVVDVATLRHRRSDVPEGCRPLIRRVPLEQCVRVDGVRVTGRMRTAIDLLADEPFDAAAAAAVRLLVDDERETRWAIPVSGRRGIERMLDRLEVSLR